MLSSTAFRRVILAALVAAAPLMSAVVQAQIITTVAGSSNVGFAGDGGPATSASLDRPTGMAVDSAGNIYIADHYNHRIRKVDTSGIITTVVGNGAAGYGGDGGPATSASLNHPYSVVVDGNGNLFIADVYNHRIRKVDTSGIITTVAGNGVEGYSNDGGAATSTSLFYPYGVAVDGTGNIYIVDHYSNRIRKVNAAGVITTVAGNGAANSSGDGGPATSASLDGPYAMALDSAGNLYIAELQGLRIRKVNASGIISTVAGNGLLGYTGDGGPATSARMRQPYGVAVDGTGILYFSDYYSNYIRKVDTGGIITTVAGNGSTGIHGDGGPALGAGFRPEGVAVDGAGNLYIADAANRRIRKVSYPTIPAAPIIGTAMAGNAEASVAFTPASDGGSPILDFTATCTSAGPPGSFQATGTSSPIAVIGLTNGVAHTCTVVARNAIGSSAASITSNSVTPQAPQSINFNQPADRTFGETPFNVSAIGGASGNPVTFGSQSAGVCTTSGTNGSTVTLVAAGSCTLRASQAGNAGFSAAPDVEQTFTINPASQTIVFGTLPDRLRTDASFTVSATGGASGNLVTFIATTAGICTSGGVNGATISLTGAVGVCAPCAQARRAMATISPQSMSTAHSMYLQHPRP
jgi:sugar lactone lactonase YvrE